MPSLHLDEIGKDLYPIGQANTLGHAIIGRIGHQHLVPSIDVGQEYIEHGFPSTTGDKDLAFGIVADAQIGIIAVSNCLSHLDKTL